MSKTVLKLENITKSYGAASSKITVLKGLNLQVQAGEMIAVIGSSGCGKSTLLHIAGLLDDVDSGTVRVGSWQNNTIKGSYQVRRNEIGFVYQYHNLLRDFSALENIAMPLIIAGKSPAKALKEADQWLEKLGLEGKASNLPGELSGGQQQRVAIGRALVHQPKLLLADEPTGNLDAKTSQTVFNLLEQICNENGTAMLMVTHNPEIASRAQRKYELEYCLKEVA